MSWTDQAMTDIKSQCIQHRNYRKALSEATATLLAADPGEVVVITGPSRVGKSRVASELSRLLIGNEDRLAPGTMPIVSVQANNCSVNGSFSTKSFTLRCLNAVQHPFYGVRPEDVWDAARLRLLDRTAESTLRPAFEKALINRKTVYLIIDEAHHIQYGRNGAAATAILDSWKCLAGETHVVLILVGAYPLLDVLRLSPHLLGRKLQVHFPRYLLNEDDLLVFEQILDAYSRIIRLPPGIRSLRDWNAWLYEDTFGCIGLLSSWLRSGLAKAKSDGSDVLTEKHMREARKPIADRQAIAKEIADGELAIRSELSGEPCVPSKINTESRHGQKQHKPFRKNPRRYRVGGRV